MVRRVRSAQRLLEDGISSHVIPSKGISNTLVNRLCTKMCRKGHFVGCYAVDRLPVRLAARGTFITVVNLGPSRNTRMRDGLSGGAGHFVTLVATPRQVRYIDPFGLPSTSKYLKTFLTACKRPLRVNQRQIQALGSAYCGLYAVLFACYFDRYLSHAANTAMHLRFHPYPQLKKNDALCEKYLLQFADDDA